MPTGKIPTGKIPTEKKPTIVKWTWNEQQQCRLYLIGEYLSKICQNLSKLAGFSHLERRSSHYALRITSHFAEIDSWSEQFRLDLCHK
jgi:hypothetical protein